jgi:hypothetical protein
MKSEEVFRVVPATKMSSCCTFVNVSNMLVGVVVFVLLIRAVRATCIQYARSRDQIPRDLSAASRFSKLQDVRVK